ncbi:MAG: OOP family OmpA-OmpF porin [Polaribacter sp.]|jgi:OOP family OmpA-OmpF porin
MKVKSILVLLSSGLYFFVCHYCYCSIIKAACYGSPTEVVATIASAPIPLSFSWSNAAPIITPGFDSEKTAWLVGKSEDNILEITGEYSLKEESTKEFNNMGLARADAIRKLLTLDLPDERIRLNSKEVQKEVNSESNSALGFSVKWIPLSENGSEVIDFGQKAVILFSTYSDKKDSKTVINDYLSAVAKRVKESGEVIFITGHTDNEGTIRKNLRLAKNRAMRIRRILRQKGVDREQIVVNSKGEQEPIASNDTEAGRYQNRRVVLEIK